MSIQCGAIGSIIPVRLVVSIFFALVLTGCGNDQQQRYSPSFSDEPPKLKTEYLFGVHPLHNPQRLFEVFNPLMDYLGRHIPDVTFKLEASRNYAAYDEKLYRQHFHFSLPNPFQTINAVDKGYHVFGKMGDDHNFRGIWLVRKDSAIKTPTDLIGKAVSYPAPTALAATMLPQYYLHTHGVNVMSDLDNRYVGSQESSVMNVYLGNVVAGATWPPPWRALSKERPELQKELKVIWETQSLPNNGLVVLPTVPQTIVEKVSQLMFQLHLHEEGQNILARMELSQFEAATEVTYQPVRDFIATFERQVRPIRK